MLALPCKKANLTDFNAPFHQFLKKVYGEDEAAKFGADITSLHQLRNSASVVGTSADQSGIQNILRYDYHLKALLPRLAGYSADLRIGFVWTEAFRPNRLFQSNSLQSDWMSILWNLGAIESYKGAMINRGSDEGIRSASVHFQQAAGIFERIRNDLLPKSLSEKKCPEFTDECLHMCRMVCI
jgi:hypothetical protein